MSLDKNETWSKNAFYVILSHLSRSRLGLVMLVTRSAKARFGQVGDQVSQVRDQVGRGQGQELDNNVLKFKSIFRLTALIVMR